MPSPGNMQQAAPLLRREVGNGEMGKVEAVTDLFFWAPKSLWTVTAAMKLTDACSLEEKL